MAARVISTFSFPTTTIFGPGTIGGLRDRLARVGISNPLVVTDPGLLQTSAFRSLRDALGPQTTWTLFGGVHPNPVEQDVLDGAEQFRNASCNGVVAFGGGSALDVGKAIRLVLKRPELKLAEFKWDDDWSGLAPCVCIPTTAGTGSEVGRSSVITLTSTKRKAVLFTPALLANVVFLDPELTVDLPPKLTAATGADALTHCIESYTCPVFHPMCDGIALEGVRLIVEALPRAYRAGQDIEARGTMLVAAAMGAVAFQKDLGVVHSLAHPLSTICGMHHGLANALCLVAGMKFCAARKSGLYRRVGIACGLDMMRASDKEADAATIAFVGEFLAGLGLNTPLRDHGVKREQIDALVAQAVGDPCHKTNAVPVTSGDFRALYEQVL
ncbi:MAG: iron-containing alcohol dehydrogenase [Verrucomicrobiales bacterium]|nr:iron-containing alcohol dehydrogenase [Verrucomicrobiales bacterium]